MHDCMDAGLRAATHDCTDAAGRITQELLPRMLKPRSNCRKRIYYDVETEITASLRSKVYNLKVTSARRVQ